MVPWWVWVICVVVVVVLLCCGVLWCAWCTVGGVGAPKQGNQLRDQGCKMGAAGPGPAKPGPARQAGWSHRGIHISTHQSTWLAHGLMDGRGSSSLLLPILVGPGVSQRPQQQATAWQKNNGRLWDAQGRRPEPSDGVLGMEYKKHANTMEDANTTPSFSCSSHWLGSCGLSAFLAPLCQLLPVSLRDQRQQAPRAQAGFVRQGCCCCGKTCPALPCIVVWNVERNFPCPRVPVCGPCPVWWRWTTRIGSGERAFFPQGL